jgi:predicted tellurium resistance membrane protein TerC
MKLWANAALIVVLLVGLVWTLQGANVIGGSFMSGQSQWLYIGIAVLIVALGALWWINFKRNY